MAGFMDVLDLAEKAAQVRHTKRRVDRLVKRAKRSKKRRGKRRRGWGW